MRLAHDRNRSEVITAQTFLCLIDWTNIVFEGGFTSGFISD